MTYTSQKYTNSKPIALIKSLAFIILFISLLMVSGFARSMFPGVYKSIAYGILGSLAGLLTIWLATKTDYQTFLSIGLVWERRTPLKFAYGLVIGLGIFILMISALLCFTELHLQYKFNGFTLQTLIVYLAIFPLAWMEEIGFRSYPLVKLNQAWGVWASQFIIAIAFGAYHILNGWSVFVAFTGPFVWAFVFGLAALKSGGIAMSTGIHFSINVLQTVAGFKLNQASVWKLDYLPGTAKSAMENTDRIGLLIHIALLLAALLATARYIQKNKRRKI